MSEMEHDQKTEEMFEVVNSHASDESKRLEDQVIKKRGYSNHIWQKYPI